MVVSLVKKVMENLLRGDRTMFSCSKKSVKEKIITFSKIGDDHRGGITRYSLSKEDEMARDYFVEKMKEIGAIITTDDFANMYATLPGSDPTKKGIVMASHIDSVKNGGNYDGVLGVISAMEVLQTIKRENIPHERNITAMIWTNEEGSLYPPAIMVSGMLTSPYLPPEIAKNYEVEKMMNSKSVIDNKTTFREALSKFKYLGAKDNRLSNDKYMAMFEAHIEQGPILEANKNDIGVVKCVLGMVNYTIRTIGEANHAGTTPMSYRKDALFAMSKIIQIIHEELDKLPSDLVYTTGQLSIHPNVHTVIPDEVSIMIDIRHESPDVIAKAVKVLKSLPQEVYGCRVEVEVGWTRDTVYFDKKLVNFIEQSVKELGYKYQFINSGAGHDAQFASYMLPTAMIFAPSTGGRSHCDEEYTSLDQCTMLASVMLNAVLKCDKA